MPFDLAALLCFSLGSSAIIQGSVEVAETFQLGDVQITRFDGEADVLPSQSAILDMGAKGVAVLTAVWESDSQSFIWRYRWVGSRERATRYAQLPLDCKLVQAPHGLLCFHLPNIGIPRVAVVRSVGEIDSWTEGLAYVVKWASEEVQQQDPLLVRAPSTFADIVTVREVFKTDASHFFGVGAPTFSATLVAVNRDPVGWRLTFVQLDGRTGQWWLNDDFERVRYEISGP